MREQRHDHDHDHHHHGDGHAHAHAHAHGDGHRHGDGRTHGHGHGEVGARAGGRLRGALARHRRTAVAAAVLAPALVVLGGVAFTSGPAAPPTSAPAAPAVDPAVAATDPRAAVTALQDRLRRLPQDDASWAALGVAYVGQARRTGDPSFYDKAEQALDRSLAVAPDGNADALAGRAALANARHDFAGGRALAEQAVAVDPYDATAKGVLADAQVELGEYAAADATLQAMVDLRPGVPSFTRVSYSYELAGKRDNARVLLERALALSSSDADAAFVLAHLGALAAGEGRYEDAVEHYDAGLGRDPSDTALLAGRAAARAAAGDVEGALADDALVVERLPQPAYLVQYGELLESLGREEEAQQQYDVAAATRALFDAAGVVPDVEVALYEADHGDPEVAVEIAQANAQTRSGVAVEDALAWSLHAAGRDEEALEHALAAQEVGTRDALVDYHRGMVQLALGQRAQAQESLELALATSPQFSPLHAPRARAALTTLASS